MELFNKLGVDLNLIVAQIINFSILMIVLYKFLYKPIVSQIEKNERDLSEAEVETKEINTEKVNLEEESKKILADARKKSTQIIEDAEAIADKIKKDATKEADEKVNKIVDHYNSIIDEDKK